MHFITENTGSLDPRMLSKEKTVFGKGWARIFYNMLKYGTEYADLGQEYYEQRYQERVIANLKRKAKQFGFELVNIKEHKPVTGLPPN